LAWVLKYRKDIKATVEIIDHETVEDAFQVPGLPSVPCFELIDRDGVHHFRAWSRDGKHGEGSVCPGCLNKWIRWNGKPPGNVEFDEPAADQRVAAAGFGGAIKARVEVVKAFAFLRERVGENVPMTFSWDRTGSQHFALLRGQDWSTEAIFGRSGHIEVSAVGAKALPVTAVGFGYAVRGDDVSIDLDPVVIAGLSRKLDFNPVRGAQRSAVSAAPVGFVDPLTAWTVFSILRSVWGVLNPQADLTLGGNVSATAVLTGDTLAIDFQQMPSIRLVMLFTFNLGVKRLEITPDSAMVYFSGSRWIKSRKFNLN
jgi:hypothetical protein